jgi:hypothetical protein
MSAPLPAVTAELLLSLHQHRLLSTRQALEMHMAGRSIRWAERVLSTLAGRGLVAFVRPGRAGEHLHFLTLAGVRSVELLSTRVERRSKLITPEQAAGTLWRHTLAVNEVGIAFMRAARERDDEFGALSWRHEIAHPIPSAAGRRELLISDALLTYIAHEPDGRLTFHYRLLELDRATVPADTLAEKLASYARLYHHTPAAREGTPGGWRALYPIFPEVVCVLAGKPRAALERRARTVLALLNADPSLKATPQVKPSLALLEDLSAHGPYAPIWLGADTPQRHDWLGGPA